MTKKQRRKNMQAIKAISRLEGIVSKELWKKGFRFRRKAGYLNQKIQSCYLH